MSKHGETERSIIRLFKEEKEFIFEEEKYEIIDIGKPSPSKGECKTDIYILTNNLNTSLNREFKISIKQNDADFLENKMSFERATEVFGDEAKDVMIKSIKSVEKSFSDDFLIYFKKFKRTEEKCLKIGWKFELLNKHGGERSGLLVLTDEQKIDVYSGSNLNVNKKNSKVNGVEICDSGVANFILKVENTDEELDFYLKDLKPIEEFAITKDIYFACKAINYRSKVDKWDGNRPLSVFIEWSLVNNVLSAKFVIDRPLEVKANEVGENIRDILNQLKINSTNFIDLKKYIDKSVNFIE
jgi:hypothetical protein